MPGAEPPELQTALTYARAGDTFVVRRLNRPGRSLQDPIGPINGLAEREVQFVSLQENLNTATPAGRLAFHFCGALAECERAPHRERTLAGLAAAKTRDRMGGRKHKVDNRLPTRAAEPMRNRTLGIPGALPDRGRGQDHPSLPPHARRPTPRREADGCDSVNHTPRREETAMPETTTTTRHQEPDDREHCQDLAAQFHELADRWEDESMFLSNSGHAPALPSHDAIVKPGDQAGTVSISLILNRGLKQRWACCAKWSVSGMAGQGTGPSMVGECPYQRD